MLLKQPGFFFLRTSVAVQVLHGLGFGLQNQSGQGISHAAASALDILGHNK